VTVLGLVERLLAWGAIAGATIYVLINALYVEFYDDFGIRPEDVGWDRLTVLSRAAWIALVGITVAGLVGWAFAAFSTRDLEVPSGGTSQDRLWRRIIRRRRMRRILGAASLTFAIVAPIGFLLVERQIEVEAAEAKRGRSGNGISLIVPFIDVRTTRANVTWLGEDTKRPNGLNAGYLTYLGRSKETVALLACGRTTLLIPADDVAVQLLVREADLPVAEQERLFQEAC
jgi:hypothetical protein